MKIVNTTDKPYDFTFDSRNFTMPPGEPMDFPDEIARHAIRRSEVLDDEGNPVAYRVASLAEARMSDRYRQIVVYRCPFHPTDDCQFVAQTPEALRSHVDDHFKPALGKGSGKTEFEDDLTAPSRSRKQ